MTILEKYSDEEFINIVKNSKSYREVLYKLGYSYYSGTSYDKIKNRINILDIDVSHFKTKKGTKRTVENVFIENSTANQSVLRRWYKKGNYTPYVCSICRHKPIWQGKDLTLVLDHINGNNTDDRLENLRWVCPNCNSQLETTCRSKNKHKKKYFCIDCGKEVQYRSNRCKECDLKYRMLNRKELPIKREDLKCLIRTIPFINIGKQFGVSDNAIRKWCKRYNLPYKPTEIKKYSDEEWIDL